MIEFKAVPTTICVDCSDLGFGEFNVLVVPDTTIHEQYRDFYLRHPKYDVVTFMFGCCCENDEEAAEVAYCNAPECIPDYISECFHEEDDEDEQD